MPPDWTPRRFWFTVVGLLLAFGLVSIVVANFPCWSVIGPEHCTGRVLCVAIYPDGRRSELRDTEVDLFPPSSTRDDIWRFSAQCDYAVRRGHLREVLALFCWNLPQLTALALLVCAAWWITAPLRRW